MGDYIPLMLSVGVILILGVMLPFAVSPFIEVDDLETTGLLNSTIDLIDDGITIGGLTIFGLTLYDGVSINPFNVLGGGKDYLVENMIYLSIIPEYILFPLIIMCLLGIAYTLIKLLPTT